MFEIKNMMNVSKKKMNFFILEICFILHTPNKKVINFARVNIVIVFRMI